MKMYRVDLLYRDIKRYDILSLTTKRVTYAHPYVSGKTKIEARASKFVLWFRQWAAAKAALVTHWQQHVDSMRSELTRANGTLGQLRGMKPPADDLLAVLPPAEHARLCQQAAVIVQQFLATLTPAERGTAYVVSYADWLIRGASDCMDALVHLVLDGSPLSKSFDGGDTRLKDLFTAALANKGLVYERNDERSLHIYPRPVDAHPAGPTD